MTQQEIDERLVDVRSRINAYQQKLSDKDYIGIKIATGVSTREDYAQDIEDAQTWREGKNKAMAEEKWLLAQVPEEETPER